MQPGGRGRARARRAADTGQPHISGSGTMRWLASSVQRAALGAMRPAARRYATLTEQYKAKEAKRRAETRANARRDEWESGSSLTGSKAVLLMLTGCTVLATGYNIELLRQRKESNALIRKRMAQVEAEQNAAMGIYAADNKPSEDELAAQKARAATLLADMQEQQRRKEEDKQRRKALWSAKQAAMEKGNKSTFQIRGDPDNATTETTEAAAAT